MQTGRREKQILPFLTIRLIFLSILFLPAFPCAQPSSFKDKNFPRLVETSELLPLLNHPAIRIIDMRSSLLDYLKGHIPNSVYLPVEALHAPRSGVPAQEPDRIYLEKLIRDYLGVSNPMWVVIYSERSNPHATFLAWVLDHLSHKKIGVLNGGWEKWVVEKLPVTQHYPSLSPGKFFGKVMPDSLAEKKWIRQHLSAKGVVIGDARSPKQYSGEEGEEIRKGHIPGAKNLFWETLLEGDEVRIWKKREDLEKLFTESGITKDKDVIVYSLTGMEASHLYFTLNYVLGYPRVRLYRGSWVEWSADPKLPVKTGPDP